VQDQSAPFVPVLAPPKSGLRFEGHRLARSLPYAANPDSVDPKLLRGLAGGGWRDDGRVRRV